MSHLPGNPYTERLVTDQQPRTSESLATLALAYEQRTANLIALMAMSPLDLTDWPQPAVDNFLTQNKNICTRLGLNEGATK